MWGVHYRWGRTANTPSPKIHPPASRRPWQQPGRNQRPCAPRRWLALERHNQQPCAIARCSFNQHVSHVHPEQALHLPAHRFPFIIRCGALTRWRPHFYSHRSESERAARDHLEDIFHGFIWLGQGWLGLFRKPLLARCCDAVDWPILISLPALQPSSPQPFLVADPSAHQRYYEPLALDALYRGSI